MRIDLDDRRGAYVLAVRDHGPGVSAAELATLFDPFVRYDAAGSGFGLGLGIARRAIAAHGGGIVATNADGGGLLVHVTVPAVRPAVLTPEAA